LELFKLIKMKYPFSEGDDYYTIEDGQVVWSCWDDVSEELYTPDIRYFATEQEAQKELIKMKRIFNLLNVLKMCCEDGKNGDWDCSSEEGKESFGDMIVVLEIIENELKQKQNGEMFLNKG